LWINQFLLHWYWITYIHTFKLRSLWFCALCLLFIANVSIGNALDSELWDVKKLLN